MKICRQVVLPAAFLLVSGVVHAAADVCQDAASQFHARSWAQAAQTFADCEKVSPGQSDALLYRSKALVNLSQFAEAAKSLETYIAAHPRSDDALYLLGYVRFRQDQPKESLAMFTRAAEVKGPEAGDLKIAALDYVLLNDYTSAARYLEQSLQMNPSDLEARYHLGRVRYQQNQFDAAIAAFEEVLRQDPTNGKAEDNLGLCLEAKNRTEAALAAYQKAIELDKVATVHNEQPYLNLGKLLNTLDRAQEAILLLSEALAIAPQSPVAEYELGRSQFLLGQFGDALPHLQRAAKLDPRNSAPHYLLGRLYKRTGKTAEAAAEFKLTEELMRARTPQSGGMTSRR
jgi:tetratricopeptide (TPR) repeat protein